MNCKLEGMLIDNFWIYWIAISLNLWKIVIIIKINALIVKYFIFLHICEKSKTCII